MKKYTGAIIGGLFGAAVIVALFFAIALSGEKQESDADKTIVVDEPAGTEQVETPACQSDDDCADSLGCFQGKCAYRCGGALVCPGGMICNDFMGYCVWDLDGERRQLACMQGIEICNGLDDDCDSESDEGCDGPNRFEHCWTLPDASSRIALAGNPGYRYRKIPGDPPAGSGLVATAPWQTLAKAMNTNSACFRLALDPGWSIEYQLTADSSLSRGCVGPYPPGTLNGAHKVTLNGAPIDPVLTDDLAGGCRFLFYRPMP